MCSVRYSMNVRAKARVSETGLEELMVGMLWERYVSLKYEMSSLRWLKRWTQSI